MNDQEFLNDVVSDDVWAEHMDEVASSFEWCPECKGLLRITQYSTGVGSMYEQAVCPDCGYTEA